MKVGILGAGIAGLSCAWLLQKEGVEVTVFESQPYVGGLARSFEWNGFSCDFAAHRLFTKDSGILKRLLEMTPMFEHERQSQIYFNNKWMKDPLDVIELARCTGTFDIAQIVWSYLSRPKSIEPDSFQTFVEQRYGNKLYDYFFRPYTEKLFGIPGDTIARSWAETKVRLAGPLDRFRQSTKTKFNRFYYPKLGGYGAIVSSMYDSLHDQVQLNSTVVGLDRTADKILTVDYSKDGQTHCSEVDVLISTLPLTSTCKMLGYDLDLSYRSVHAVYLLLNKPRLSDNHWIYFMDDEVVVNRLVEFKNMSPVGAPRDTTVVCAEVTCVDEHMVDRTIQSLVATGLLAEKDVLDSQVITEKYAYPVYSYSYEDKVAKAKQHLDQYGNLFVVGRAAEYKHREVDDNFSAAVETTSEILGKLMPAKSEPNLSSSENNPSYKSPLNRPANQMPANHGSARRFAAKPLL